jgi:hypothetical protein
VETLSAASWAPEVTVSFTDSAVPGVAFEDVDFARVRVVADFELPLRDAVFRVPDVFEAPPREPDLPFREVLLLRVAPGFEDLELLLRVLACAMPLLLSNPFWAPFATRSERM